MVFEASGPHCVSSRSVHVRVVSATGLCIAAESIWPSRVSTRSRTSNVSLPISAVNPSSCLDTCTKLLGLADVASCIHFAGTQRDAYSVDVKAISICSASTSVFTESRDLRNSVILEKKRAIIESHLPHDPIATQSIGGSV